MVNMVLLMASYVRYVARTIMAKTASQPGNRWVCCVVVFVAAAAPGSAAAMACDSCAWPGLTSCERDYNCKLDI